MRALLAVVAIFLAMPLSVASAQRGCRKVEFDGSVARGQTFTRALGPALQFHLDPVANGWRVRVFTAGPHAGHDAAEVATPPYDSANPLLLSTDFNLRAQDVVSWNPRDFQFATSASAAESASRDEDTLLDKTSSPEKKKAAEARLVLLATHAAHGELKILNAALVPGTADQSPQAAAVAAHWRTTPHTLVQPAAGKPATPQGSVESLQFRVTLWLPRDIVLPRDLSAVPAACPQ